MFDVKKQECIIKGIETREPGTFETSDGRKIPYDGYTQVIICIKDKNNKYIDLKTRIANSTDGQLLVKKLSELELMTKVYLDLEIQVSASGSTKFFITGFSVLK